MMAVWYLMRGTGVVALVLLTGAMALGIATWGRVALGTLPRFATLALHRSLALMAVAFVAVHVATAAIDPYAAVGLVDVLVPFTAEQQPLAVGLGALALDGVVALSVTGALRRRIGARAFRAVHWAAYAAWPAALLHALAIGSDTAAPWLRGVAIACAATIAAAVAYRTAVLPRVRVPKPVSR